jgi:SAM-dependent methyltransferase
MRVLLAIAHHGTKNRSHLLQVLDVYRNMRSFHVDIVLIVDRPRDLGDDLHYLVGAPTADPWSLPFRHRQLFAERIDDYDLFIYSEDDTLVEERHLDTFVELTRRLPSELVTGFLRYELDEHGHRSYNDLDYGFHFDPTSARLVDGVLVAEHTNPHAAMWMLTREQLRRVVDHPDFLAAPHPGRFDLLVQAACGPYLAGPLQKVIPLSRLDDIGLHHLPNRYIGRTGTSAPDLEQQIGALRDIAEGHLSPAQLLPIDQPRPNVRWDKSYHERPIGDPLLLIRPDSQRILSVGTGNGALEAKYCDRPERIDVIPLDNVVGRVAAARGLRVFEPDLAGVLANLDGQRYDEVLLVNLLQHLPDPVDTLRRLQAVLEDDGRIVVVVPNLRRARIRRLLTTDCRWFPGLRGTTAGIHVTTPRVIRRWAASAGLTIANLSFPTRAGYRAAPPGTGAWLSTDIVLALRSAPPD